MTASKGAPVPSVRVEIVDLEIIHPRPHHFQATTRAGLGAAALVVAAAAVGEGALLATGDGLSVTPHAIAVTAPDPAPGEPVLAPEVGITTLTAVGPAALGSVSGALVIDNVATTSPAANVPPPVVLSRGQALVRRSDGTLVVVASTTLRRVVASF
jgi:hypothetical protein